VEKAKTLVLIVLLTFLTFPKIVSMKEDNYPNIVFWSDMDTLNESGKLKDFSHYGNNGTLNGTTFMDGRYNRSLSFDGSNDYIEIPDHDSLDMEANQDFSILVWVNFSPHGTGRITSKRSGAGTPDWYSLFAYSNKITFEIASNYIPSTIETNSIVGTNQWHFIGAVRNCSESKMYLYLNGALDNEGSVTNDSLTNNDPLQLGQYQADIPNQNYEGLLDEFRIFKKALTSTEILSYMETSGREYIVKSGIGKNMWNADFTFGREGSSIRVVTQQYAGIIGKSDFDASNLMPRYISSVYANGTVHNVTIYSNTLIRTTGALPFLNNPLELTGYHIAFYYGYYIEGYMTQNDVLVRAITYVSKYRNATISFFTVTNKNSSSITLDVFENLYGKNDTVTIGNNFYDNTTYTQAQDFIRLTSSNQALYTNVVMKTNFTTSSYSERGNTSFSNLWDAIKTDANDGTLDNSTTSTPNDFIGGSVGISGMTLNSGESYTWARSIGFGYSLSNAYAQAENALNNVDTELEDLSTIKSNIQTIGGESKFEVSSLAYWARAYCDLTYLRGTGIVGKSPDFGVDVGYTGVWIRDYYFMVYGCPFNVNWTMVKDLLEIWADNQNASTGQMPDYIDINGVVSFDHLGINPLDNNPHFVQLLYLYYAFTKDDTTLNSLIFNARNAMTFMHNKLGFEGLVVGGKYQEGYRDQISKEGVSTYINLLYYDALRKIAELEHLLGNLEGRGTLYNDRAFSIETSLNRYSYSTTHNFYISFFNSTGNYPYLEGDTNGLAISLDIANPDVTTDIFNVLLVGNRWYNTTSPLPIRQPMSYTYGGEDYSKYKDTYFSEYPSYQNGMYWSWISWSLIEAFIKENEDGDYSTILDDMVNKIWDVWIPNSSESPDMNEYYSPNGVPSGKSLYPPSMSVLGLFYKDLVSFSSNGLSIVTPHYLGIGDVMTLRFRDTDFSLHISGVGQLIRDITVDGTSISPQTLIPSKYYDGGSHTIIVYMHPSRTMTPSWIDNTTFALGVSGLILMVASPTWCALTIRKKGLDPDSIERCAYGLLIFCCGFGLLIMWLW